MGTGRGHEYTAPNQAKNAGITPNNPKKKGGLSASENPIGIETGLRGAGAGRYQSLSASENPIGIETMR